MCGRVDAKGKKQLSYLSVDSMFFRHLILLHLVLTSMLIRACKQRPITLPRRKKKTGFDSTVIVIVTYAFIPLLLPVVLRRLILLC